MKPRLTFRVTLTGNTWTRNHFDEASSQPIAEALSREGWL